MLFEPQRHEPLRDAQWDATRAHAAVQAIVADLEEHLSSVSLWPAHPLDEAPELPTGYKTLYLGAAGTLWAMWYLAREGAVKLRKQPRDLIGHVYDAYRGAPDIGKIVPSYNLGEVGILLIMWRLTESREAADRLWTCIEQNIPNPTNEALWAAPGTMVGAAHARVDRRAPLARALPRERRATLAYLVA